MMKTDPRAKKKGHKSQLSKIRGFRKAEKTAMKDDNYAIQLKETSAQTGESIKDGDNKGNDNAASISEHTFPNVVRLKKQDYKMASIPNTGLQSTEATGAGLQTAVRLDDPPREFRGSRWAERNERSALLKAMNNPKDPKDPQREMTDLLTGRFQRGKEPNKKEMSALLKAACAKAAAVEFAEWDDDGDEDHPDGEVADSGYWTGSTSG